MPRSKVQDYIIKNTVVKAALKSFPNFTKDDLFYILEDQTLNIKHSFENKLDITLHSLGTFCIKESKRVALDFQAEYLNDRGIELNKLPKSLKEEIKTGIYKTRIALVEKLKTDEPIILIREILKLKNNIKNNVK